MHNLQIKKAKPTHRQTNTQNTSILYTIPLIVSLVNSSLFKIAKPVIEPPAGDRF